MIIKQGNVVSHAGAVEWGAGKVMEISSLRATIQFSDGIIRKIASSHYINLRPADPGLFIPLPEAVPVVKTVRAPRAKKKLAQPAAA